MNNKKTLRILFLFLIFCSTIYLLNHYNNGTNADYSETPSKKANELSQLILNEIEKNYSFSNFLITEHISKDNNNFVFFIFHGNNMNLYEGLCYASQDSNDFYSIKDIDIVVTDTKVPFTHHSMVAILDNGQPYKLLSGYINDENINEIRIYYNNNTITVFKIEEKQLNYLEFLLGRSYDVKKIEGLNSDGEIIYFYEW